MGKALVTLQQYKDYEGISSPNNDTEISSIIPRVSQLVKNYCRRTFIDYYDEATTEMFAGGDDILYLSEAPLVSIQSFEYSSDFGKTYTSLVEYTDWVYDSVRQGIVPITVAEFPSYVNGYKVTYTGGYEFVPEDLQIAVLDLVTYYRQNDAAVHSPKAPGTNSVQIEYISTTNLPAHIKRILDLYVADYT